MVIFCQALVNDIARGVFICYFIFMPERKVTSIKKVLLINPFKLRGHQSNIGVDPVVSRHVGQEIKTGVTFPIGLAYMASTLLEAGFEVKLLDPIAEETPVEKIYQESEWADAIVLPFSAGHTDDVRQYRNDFRRKFFVLGGGYAHHIADWLFKEDFGDVILCGEPEYTIVDLMRAYPSYQNVSGIIYKDREKIVRTPDRPLLTDLDKLPFPARHLTNPKNYWEIMFLGEPTVWILPTRGCPYDCIFCAQRDLNKRRVRYRSPQNIVDELEEIVRKYGVKNFVFFDETFNFNHQFVINVCQEILFRGLKIKWWCAARADRVRTDVVKIMKKAGCIELRFGLESANDEILKYFQKGETIADIRRGLEIVKKEGMNFSLQCIFGAPQESEETIKNTMTFIKEMKPFFVSFNVLTPLPGSQLYEQIKDKIKPEDMRSFDILHTKYPLGRYSGEELQQIIKRAYLSYYLSFGFAQKTLEQALRNPKLVFGLTRMLLKQAFYVYRSIFRKREI